ncbi:MAG TPA: hypothetical protein VLB76_17145 [Thermoanaerobaculia bacterium]|jgi:hypothetical protein|nr:hypothetical protein [Thermoanaerobaculia bacterium]
MKNWMFPAGCGAARRRHNVGSPHTHCYAPPTDTCYNGEACYTGSTSCPAPVTINGVTNVKGTVMSYCHLTGCGSTAVFHPHREPYRAEDPGARQSVHLSTRSGKRHFQR